MPEGFIYDLTSFTDSVNGIINSTSEAVSSTAGYAARGLGEVPSIVSSGMAATAATVASIQHDELGLFTTLAATFAGDMIFSGLSALTGGWVRAPTYIARAEVAAAIANAAMPNTLVPRMVGWLAGSMTEEGRRVLATQAIVATGNAVFSGARDAVRGVAQVMPSFQSQAQSQAQSQGHVVGGAAPVGVPSPAMLAEIAEARMRRHQGQVAEGQAVVPDLSVLGDIAEPRMHPHGGFDVPAGVPIYSAPAVGERRPRDEEPADPPSNRRSNRRRI